MPVSGHTLFLWGPLHATRWPGDAEKPDQGGENFQYQDNLTLCFL